MDNPETSVTLVTPNTQNEDKQNKTKNGQPRDIGNISHTQYTERRQSLKEYYYAKHMYSEICRNTYSEICLNLCLYTVKPV
jgi:hypothetical protein